MLGNVAWRLGLGKGHRAIVVCEMLRDFDCEYPWFESIGSAPVSSHRATSTRSFELPDYPITETPESIDAIVVAHAIGYRWFKVERFVVTLRSTGFAGGIHIAVNRESAMDAEWLRHSRCYNLTLWVPPNITDVALHTQLKRWEELRDYLQVLTDESARNNPSPTEPLILVIDIRDTYFQSNPFTELRWLGHRGATQVRACIAHTYHRPIIDTHTAHTCTCTHTYSLWQVSNAPDSIVLH